MGSKNIKIYFFIIMQLYNNNNYITIKQVGGAGNWGLGFYIDY
jgi:hypothetical protein